MELRTFLRDLQTKGEKQHLWMADTFVGPPEGQGPTIPTLALSSTWPSPRLKTTCWEPCRVLVSTVPA